jgi:hypothetical protein
MTRYEFDVLRFVKELTDADIQATSRDNVRDMMREMDELRDFSRQVIEAVDALKVRLGRRLTH